MILPVDSVDLSQYDAAELLRLQSRIAELLPQASDLDLQAELVAQFLSAKQLLADAQRDTETPLNQKAQIINSAAALLKQLSDQQIKLHTSERFRAMEAALIDLLKDADPEEREAFLAAYEKRLEVIT